MSNYIAIDLGATSGRIILGTLDAGKLKLEELSRFPNEIITHHGRCFWNIWNLYSEIIKGLRIAASRNVEIVSIGIDTWGVDFVMIGKDGEPLGAPRSYRDPHTEGEPQRYFNEKISADELYDITGIQVMPFNSLFQLSAMRRAETSALEAADKILFLPDALAYMLTGEMVTEYTIASTSHMVNARSRQLDDHILKSVGLTKEHFGRAVMPGTRVGILSEEIQAMTGLGAIPVIAVAGHDTGSAVVAVPASKKGFAYLSSGTWSLMGIELDTPIINDKAKAENFTHEGGVAGKIRFLKNICGMWIIERCREEWKQQGLPIEFHVLIEMAQANAPFCSFIFPDDPIFTNPASMTEAIREYCQRTLQPIPQTQGEFTRCIFESLAMRYRQVFEILKEFAPFEIECLHIIGGGSQNDFLNTMTANALGVEVVAGPSECTAAGNILVQAMAAGEVSGVEGIRKVMADSHSPKIFKPSRNTDWESAYRRYLSLTHQ